MKRRECISSLHRGDRLFLSAEQRVSSFSIQREQTPSLRRGECFPSLYRGGRFILLATGRVSLLRYRESRLFLMQRRECFSSLYKGGKHLLYIQRRECLSFLDVEGADSFSMQMRVFLFSVYRRQTYFPCRGKSVFFSRYRESRLLLYADERVFPSHLLQISSPADLSLF